MICCAAAYAVTAALSAVGWVFTRKNMTVAVWVVIAALLLMVAGHYVIHQINPNICRGSGAHKWLEEIAWFLRM